MFTTLMPHDMLNFKLMCAVKLFVCKQETNNEWNMQASCKMHKTLIINKL